MNKMFHIEKWMRFIELKNDKDFRDLSKWKMNELDKMYQIEKRMSKMNEIEIRCLELKNVSLLCAVS